MTASLFFSPKAFCEPQEPKQFQPIAIKSGTVTGHNTWKYWELVVDLKSAELRIVHRKGGARLEEMLPANAVAGLNGGYWMADYRPTGWVRDASQTLRKKGGNRAAKVLAVAGSQVHIGPAVDLKFEPEFVIQNSPLLVERSGRLGILRDDGRRASRTVACQGETKPLSFIVIIAPPGDGPTLRETAEMLTTPETSGGFGCLAALNLDGGPSSGLWLQEGSGALPSLPLVPIGYGIAILGKN